MKNYWISGDGTGKTYEIYYGSSIWAKDLLRVAEGIKTLKQAQKKIEELKNEQTKRNR